MAKNQEIEMEEGGIEISLDELNEPRGVRHLMKSFDHPKEK